MRVLFIDDDRDGLNEIMDDVEDEYVVDLADNPTDGSYFAQVNDYDAIVLDSELKSGNCLEVCKNAKEHKKNVPILYLTGTSDKKQKLKSLEAGADLYLDKPVTGHEIVDHLRVLIRRKSVLMDSMVTICDVIRFDAEKRKVWVGKKEIVIRRKAYDVLEYLILNHGRAVSKEELLEHVWQKGIDVMSNTVEVHVKHLRDIFFDFAGVKVIKTLRGFGYIIDGRDVTYVLPNTKNR